MPITPSLRHCSNKYNLAREGEKDKEKDEDLEKVNNHIFDKERCSLGFSKPCLCVCETGPMCLVLMANPVINW